MSTADVAVTVQEVRPDGYIIKRCYSDAAKLHGWGIYTKDGLTRLYFSAHERFGLEHAHQIETSYLDAMVDDLYRPVGDPYLITVEYAIGTRA